MFNFLRRKKAATPPTTITVEEYVREGWQANVDNGVCDVYCYDGNHGQLVVNRIEPHKEGYRIEFDNSLPLIYYPQIHKLKLFILYWQSTVKPTTLPEEIKPLIGIHIYTK